MTNGPLSWLPAIGPAVEVVEGAVERVEAERLPRLAGRGVVPCVQHGRGPTRVADRPGDRVHADVVVAVAHEQRDRLALLGLSQLEVGGGLGRLGVERLALVVGAHRAADQPAGLGGRRTHADLDAVGLGRQRHGRPEEGAQRDPVLLGLLGLRVSVPRLPEGERQGHQEHPGHGTAAGAQPAEELAAPVRSEEQPDGEGHQADAEAADGGRHGDVADRGLHLGHLRLGLAGDEGVALDQLVGRPGLGLAEHELDPDRPVALAAYVGQQRPGAHHHVPVEGRLHRRVVAGHDDRPAPGEEQGDRRDHRDDEAAHRHGDGGDGAGAAHARARACAIE